MATPGDMTEYQAMAENAMRASRATGTRRVVSNRGTEHARAVTRVLVASAESSLAFLCGHFSPDVFDADAVREFLDKPGARMSVLVDGEPEAASLRSLASYMAGTDPKLRVRRLAQEQTVHFGVADVRDVRIETDVRLRKATVVFGDPVLARGAVDRFDALWEQADTVRPPVTGTPAA